MNAIREPSEPMGGDLEPAFRDECFMQWTHRNPTTLCYLFTNALIQNVTF